MVQMLETAVESDADLRVTTVVPALDPAATKKIRSLLESLDLDMDDDIELFVTAHDGDELVACLGLAGSVLKCLGCSQRAQGYGVSALLMNRMNYEALDRGRTHLFAYTKPGNREIFESLGFYALAEVPGAAVLLENTPFGLASYLARLRRQRVPGRRIGGIVLNANPFTLGHRYLVETAASQVDALHVFVVSEDASLFGADARLRLVRAGVAELREPDRIKVHPGDRYVVSRATFPRYFIKGAAEREHAAAGLDLQLFRNHIAPTLGITDRFVGSEPLSPVTNAYNEEMAYWLEQAPSPKPAIGVHLIERLVHGGDVISASRVREAIAAGDFETIGRLVPAPTLDYIKQHYLTLRS